MKKWLIFLLLPALIPIMNVGTLGGENITSIEPVQAVLLEGTKGQLSLRTDTGAAGVGQTIEEAVQQMNDTSSVNVFLDTADYLLCDEGAIPEEIPFLRPSCRVCYLEETVDLEAAAKYLKQHEPEITLAMYEAGKRNVPHLIREGGGFRLVP